MGYAAAVPTSLPCPADLHRFSRVLASVVALGCLGTGCRCKGAPSEESLPRSQPNPATSQDIPAGGTCPARPSWAGALTDDVEVELLHTSEQGERKHGTGYRLHADGSFETYDDIAIEPNDAGRMVFKPVEGKWTLRGSIEPKSLAAFRKTLAAQSADSLAGKWRTNGARTAMTLLTTHRDGSKRTLCYLGMEPPQSAQSLQKEIHDLVNHVAPSD